MKYVKKTFLSSLALIFILTLLTCLMISFNTNDTAFAETENQNLTFTLNNEGTGYSVKAANRQIQEAIIPDSYNNLPVTEVENNGFLSCTNLEKVIIPESVLKVGSNAFFNCRNLIKLRGMSNVKEIGNNAFAMCTSLTNLIIPSDVETLGSNIIRSVSNDVYVRNTEVNIMALNAEWNANSTATIIYGNDLTCTEIKEDDNTLIGYSVDEYQLLDYSSEDVNLICSYELEGVYYPILEFSDMAFAGSMFKSLTVSKDTEHLDIDYSVKLGSGAFLAVYSDYIIFDVDVEIEESGVDIFASATFTRIVFKNAINIIPERTFQYCSNLYEIVIADNINNLSNTTAIGANAFEECYSLNQLYIPSTVDYIGNSAFHNWGTGIDIDGEPIKQKLVIDLNGPKDEWSKTFLGSPNYDNFSIEYNKVMVMFSKDGGDGGTNYIEAMYGQDMPIAEAPQKQNFDFQGYFSELNGNGTQYYDENMNSINTWDKTEPTILYAFWTAAENKVYLDKQDGSDVTDFVTVSLNQDMPAGIVAPERSGYTFAGYFAEENGNGKKYYNAEMISVNVWDSTTGGTIYAFWISNSYTVVFEKEGGVGGDSYITATFGAQMPNAVAPTKVGFEFNGYYIGDKCYYDKNMQSRCVWDIPENAVLSAQWTPKEYIIELNHDYGDIIEKITVAFGDDMPEGDIPQRMGYTFHGYFEAQNGKGAQYYSAEMNSLKKWEIDNDGTLYAYWTIIEYTINYQVDDWKGQTNPNPTSYTVEDEIIFENLEADGYNFNWTPANIIQGSINNITVSGIWINKPYTIILDNQAYVAVFDMDMPQAPIPIRQGYTFNGYFYNGIKYYNADMTSAHKWDEAHNATLEAEWIPNIYEITLSTGKVYATYGEAMPEASIPVKTGYKFFGYFTETNGAGDMYYDAEMQSVREWDIAKDTTLYPYWKQLYTVTFNKGGGVGGTNSVEVVYGEDMPIAIAPAMAYNKFNGYYLNGDNNPYYLADMTSNRKMDQQQDITLIAKYTPIQYTISYNLDDSLSLPASNDSRNALSITYYDTVTLYAPYREHFEFDAWDLNGVEVTTLENIDSNITLTAKWIGIRAVPTPNGTNNYDSPFVNIEFTRIITNVSYNINIGPNVKELYIFANFTNPIDVTMSIVVLDKVVSTGGLIISQRNSALKLTISNVNITAVSGSHAILMDSEYSLILYSYNSSITGSSTLTPKNDTLTTKQGSSAIYCKHLILNTSVTLKGGSNSSMSSTPFVGGVAVSLVEGGDIFLQSDGVKIIGGSCNGLIGYAGCAVYANNGNYKIIDREYYSVQIDYGAGTEPNLSTNPPYVGY